MILLVGKGIGSAIGLLLCNESFILIFAHTAPLLSEQLLVSSFGMAHNTDLFALYAYPLVHVLL